MGVVQRKLSGTFKDFFESEKSSGILLILCTGVSLLLVNSIIGANYLSIWQMYVGGLSVEHWVNDALMAVFFLLIGLELERELDTGELSAFKNVLLPMFALANTGIVIGADWAQNLTSANSAGIIGGLVVGKPLGITLLSFVAVAIGICKLPLDLNWWHVFGAGLLGGIGFTMSIFITNLAFAANVNTINASKMAILLASVTAGTLGFLWLKLFGKPTEADKDMETMDFHATTMLAQEDAEHPIERRSP